MGMGEIAAAIESNLHTLKIGDIFSKKTKLYKHLGIPTEEAPNEMDKVLKRYVTWDKTGKQNKNGAVSNEIKILDIMYDYHYIDGRSENGGAHNEVYITQLKPLLLHFFYKNNILTFKDIMEEIYGFNRTLFENYTSDSGIEFYIFQLESKLRDITEAALDSLMREKLLYYVVEWQIVSCNKYTLPFEIPTASEILEDAQKLIDFNVKEAESRIDLKNTNIKEMLLISRPSLKESDFVSLAENISAAIKIPFYFETTNVLEFIDIVIKNKINVDILVDGGGKKEKKRHTAWLGESTLIDKITSNIRDHLGYSASECIMNPQKRKALYKRMDLFWRLIGWKYIYKAYRIIIQDNNPGTYPLIGGEVAALHENLEKYMVKKVNEKYVASDVCDAKLLNDKTKIRHREKRKYWVAANEKVKERHCKIFGRSIDEDIFREDVEEYVSEITDIDPSEDDF